MVEDKKTKEEVTNAWFVQYIPARYQVVDPRSKTIIAEAEDMESLRLQLTVMTAQDSHEAAIGTR